MAGYIKLFGSILDSTVWNEPGSTRLVWITMLAMADQHGCVWASVPGLAKRAGVERDECERALACFLAPDPDSRTRDFDGRRIGEIDGGWELLNHAKFREMMSAEDQKAKAAERQKRFRERNANSNAQTVTRNAPSQEVTLVTTSDQKQIRLEAEEEGEQTALARDLFHEFEMARLSSIQNARHLRPTPANVKHIAARLAEGATADDVRHVIASCVRDVRGGGDQKWFNPSAAFRPDNFARHLATDVTAPPRPVAGTRPEPAQRQYEDLGDMFARIGGES